MVIKLEKKIFGRGPSLFLSVIEKKIEKTKPQKYVLSVVASSNDLYNMACYL